MTRQLTMTTTAAGRPGLRRVVLLALFILIPIADVQFWIATAGWAAWSRGTRYVSLLADAFDHGQVSLRTLPDPHLLALPDPYDPDANAKYRLHDALLFDGKYYFYWGPAPALLTAAVCGAIGITPDFCDQYLAFAFAFGMVAATFVLVALTKEKLFPNLSFATVCVPVVSLGLGTPLLFTLGRGAVYEVAICAGQFFLLSGFCAALCGLSRLFGDRASATRWMTAAGILWAFSIGSRVSLIPGVAAAEAITLYFLLRRPRRSLPAAAGLAGPFIAAVALLGWYNYIRFHSFTDFGMHWLLGGVNQHAQPPHDLFRLSYMTPNLYCYLLAGPDWLRGFPFVHAAGELPRIIKLFHLPEGFQVESVVGLAWTQPILIFAVLALAIFWRRKADSSIGTTVPGENNSLGIWLVGTLSVAAIIGFIPALSIKVVTMRYLLDAVPCLTILAVLGYWQLLNALHPASRRLANIAAAILLTAQSAMGFLLAITGYYGNFQNYNPRLFDSMARFFDRL